MVTLAIAGPFDGGHGRLAGLPCANMYRPQRLLFDFSVRDPLATAPYFVRVRGGDPFYYRVVFLSSFHLFVLSLSPICVSLFEHF